MKLDLILEGRGCRKMLRQVLCQSMFCNDDPSGDRRLVLFVLVGFLDLDDHLELVDAIHKVVALLAQVRARLFGALAHDQLLQEHVHALTVHFERVVILLLLVQRLGPRQNLHSFLQVLKVVVARRRRSSHCNSIGAVCLADDAIAAAVAYDVLDGSLGVGRDEAGGQRIVRRCRVHVLVRHSLSISLSLSVSMLSLSSKAE